MATSITSDASSATWLLTRAFMVTTIQVVLHKKPHFELLGAWYCSLYYQLCEKLTPPFRKQPRSTYDGSKQFFLLPSLIVYSLQARIS
jgi:hypothetical protein